MAQIKTDKTLVYSPKGTPVSYRATPEMGVIKHFPAEACAGLVALGAEYVGKEEPLKKGRAKDA